MGWLTFLLMAFYRDFGSFVLAYLDQKQNINIFKVFNYNCNAHNQFLHYFYIHYSFPISKTILIYPYSSLNFESITLNRLIQNASISAIFFIFLSNNMKSQNFRMQDQKSEGIQTNRKFYQQAHPDQAVSQIPKNFLNARLGRRKKFHTKQVNLQNVIQRHKVNKCVHNYVKKLRLNSIYRSPCQYEQNKVEQKIQKDEVQQPGTNILKQLKQSKGISIGNLGLVVWSCVNILQITLMVFIFSIIITFHEICQSQIFLYMRASSIILYIFDILLNLTVKRYEYGKYLQKISDISQYYMRNGFFIDMVSILIFPVDIMFDLNNSVQVFVFFLSIIKLVNNIKKFQKFQYLFINTERAQHVYGLVKVCIANFAIAHFLSIILNLIGSLNPSSNWLLKLGIAQSEWYVKYVWGYYWGTTIMLTIGFGDICATTFQEAIALIFVQIFSCVTLAYNINYVGSLINSLRQTEKSKKKKLKVFHKMCKDSLIAANLEEKVSNFISEQYRIKQNYEFDSHDQILKSLPKVMQKQFRKQANKNLFDNLGFFSNFSRKSLLQLAQQISRKICHPQEIIIKRGSIPDFTVLQNGDLGFICKIRSRLDNVQIQNLRVNEGERPKILSFDFIKNKFPNYNIKSNTYSVIYYLSREQLMQTLRNSQMSYQMFCMYKDKDEYILDENNAHPCPVCKIEYHTKFQCSRLHYIPLSRAIVLKQIAKDNRSRQPKTFQFNRIKIKAKFSHQQLKIAQKRYIEDNFDDWYYSQLENIEKFYKKENELIANSKQQQQQPYKISLNSGFRTTCLGLFKQSQSQHEQGLTKSLGQELRMSRNPSQLMPPSNQSALSRSSSNLRLAFGNRTYSRLQELLVDKNKSSFWELEIDIGQNFQYYLIDQNPENLIKRNKFRKSKAKTTYLSH